MSSSKSAGLLLIEGKEILLYRSQEDKLNIFNMVVEFNFYQDIFSPFLTGSLVIIDALGLISEAKFDGAEKVTMEVYNEYDPSGKKYKLTFNVSGITNRAMENYKTNTYILHLVSTEAIIDANIALSKKYSGNPETIIKTILTNELGSNKPFISEPTKYPTEMIPAQWTPFYTANWLASRSISSVNDNASYFFFETFDGFTFTSLQGDTTKIPYITYKARAPNMSSSSLESNLLYNLTTPIDFKVKESSNVLDNVANGMFNSTLYTKDLIKNEYVRKDFDFVTDFNSTKKLNGKLPFKTIFKGSGVTAVGYNHSTAHTLDDANRQLNWYQKRLSTLEQINITSIQLTVPGLFSLQAGFKVYLEVPKVIRDSNGNILDKQLSGVYVITALRHICPDKNTHHMVLELIKDSIIL